MVETSKIGLNLDHRVKMSMSQNLLLIAWAHDSMLVFLFDICVCNHFKERVDERDSDISSELSLAMKPNPWDILCPSELSLAMKPNPWDMLYPRQFGALHVWLEQQGGSKLVHSSLPSATLSRGGTGFSLCDIGGG
jgi:hypothetical protein